MPNDFTKCVEMGGKVRTKVLNKDEYMHVCIWHGQTHAGEIKQYKRLSTKAPQNETELKTN